MGDLHEIPFFSPLVHMSTYRPIPLGPSPLNNVPLYNNPPDDRLGLRLPHVILLLFPRGIHAMARYMNKVEVGKEPASVRKRLGGALPFTGQNSFGEGRGLFSGLSLVPQLLLLKRLAVWADGQVDRAERGKQLSSSTSGQTSTGRKPRKKGREVPVHVCMVEERI